MVEQRFKKAQAKMPIAYFVTCHRSKEFIADQIQVLYRKNDLFIYHIDPKSSDDLKLYIRELAEKNANIIVMPPRNYSWAGFSQVHTVIDAIVIALAYGPNWTHFIPLSEQHLPTIRADAIEASLAPGESYIGNTLYSEMPPDAQRDIRHRFDKRYIELPGVGSFATEAADIERAFFDTLRHGSNWYILSRENCIHLRALFANEQKIDRLKHCVHGDETIIITLSYLIPELAESIRNIDKTFVAWPHLTDNNDMIFTEDNFFDAIAEGKPFIRKRPDILTERVKVALGLQKSHDYRGILSYFRKKLPLSYAERATAPTSSLTRTNHPINHIENIFRSTFPHGNWAIYHRSGNANVPTVLMSYKSTRMPDDLSIFVLSQDNSTFKLAVVTDFETEKPFVDTQFYGMDSYLIRARVEHMFFHYELSIADMDRGFVNVASLDNLTDLLDKFHYYVGEVEKLKS